MKLFVAKNKSNDNHFKLYKLNPKKHDLYILLFDRNFFIILAKKNNKYLNEKHDYLISNKFLVVIWN